MQRLEEKSSPSVGDRTPAVQSVVKHWNSWSHRSLHTPLNNKCAMMAVFLVILRVWGRFCLESDFHYCQGRWRLEMSGRLEEQGTTYYNFTCQVICNIVTVLFISNHSSCLKMAAQSLAWFCFHQIRISCCTANLSHSFSTVIKTL
jgi:hypothetical protein